VSVENGKDDEDTSEDINQDDGERKSEGKFAFSGLQRLARQLDDDYPLLANEVFKVFIQSCNVQVAAITREGFQRRFERFLQKVAQSIETPAPEVLDGLFHQAIQAKRQIATWKNIAKAIKSDKFGRSLKFLRVEIKRFETSTAY
jgi:hypothetical protein